MGVSGGRDEPYPGLHDFVDLRKSQIFVLVYYTAGF